MGTIDIPEPHLSQWVTRGEEKVNEFDNSQSLEMIEISASSALESPREPEPPALNETPDSEFLGTSGNGDPSVESKFTVLDGLVRLLTSDIRFADFVRDALLMVLRAVQCEAGSILEVDHKTETLFFRAVVGQRSETLTSFTLPMGQGIVGHVAESKQPLIVENIQDNKIHLKAVARTVGFEVHNLAAVPIVIRGRTFGVLELLNRTGQAEFSVQDQETLNYFCEMFAKVVEIRLMIAWGNYQRQTVVNSAEKLGEVA